MSYRKESQVIYNYHRSRVSPELRTYFFVVINTRRREIENTVNRIYNALSPIIEEWESFSGRVEGTDLKFQVIPFDSESMLEDQAIKRVYRDKWGKSKTIKDKNLDFKEDRNGLERYVNQQLNSS